MKKIIAGMILSLVFAGNAAAEKEMTTCSLLALIAKKTMESRQSGTPLSKYLELAESTDLPQAIKNALRDIALIAWDTPKFSTDRNKKEAITEFENKMLLECLKNEK